jgi:pilus assembly protein CpaE
MSAASNWKQTELTVILVCPDRGLAQQFASTIADLKTLNILADLKEYPAAPVLDQRLKQLRPDAMLIDVGTDRDGALFLLSQIIASFPTLSVIGLHGSNNPETILLCLRSGVAEFLHAPFRRQDVEQAVMRLVRRKESEVRNQPARGELVTFVPAKPGSGSTTIACNVAHMLARVSQKKVLLADLDLTAGTVSFLFKLNHNYSLLDGIQHSHQLDESLWGSLVANRWGLDILPAPEKPYALPIEPYRVHECLEYARSIYDYVVVDLASITEKVSLAMLNEADQIYLVANPELPVMFLARKTLALLEEMGFHKEQVRVLVNRLHKQEELSKADMEKIFRFPVFSTFPNDYPSVRRSLTEGRPVAENCELGKTYRRFAEGVAGLSKTERKRVSVTGLKTLFSES